MSKERAEVKEKINGGALLTDEGAKTIETLKSAMADWWEKAKK